MCDSDDVDNRGSTEHMRVGRIAITQPLGTVMPLYHTRGGRIHLCVYLCEVPQCIRNIQLFWGAPLLRRKFWVKQMILGQQRYLSSSSILQALRFVNTIISSKHYLKTFVVVVGG